MTVQRKKGFHKIVGFNKIHKSSQRQYLHKACDTDKITR